MQDPRMPLSDEIPNHIAPQKKKGSTKKAPSLKPRKNDAKMVLDGSLPPKSVQKVSKRLSRKDASLLVQQPERSNSDSLPDSSASGNEYRALRRKYLLLEEESFALGSSLKGLEDEVKTLEEEKLALLDELVVLEGLIDPSEFQTLSQGKL